MLQRAISDSLKWYLQNYHDFWDHDEEGKLFYENPRGHKQGYDIYTGFKTSVEFHEVPQLVVKSITKFIYSTTLAENIKGKNVQESRRTYGNQNFILDRPEPTNCKLYSISEQKTVSDKTIDDGDNRISVLDHVSREYGNEWADQIDPQEPLVQVRFGDSNPFDAAPSLLKGSPDRLNRSLSSEAAMSAQERIKAIQDFISRISYIQIEGDTLTASCREFAKLVVDIVLFSLELTDPGFDPVDVNRTENKLTEVFIANDGASSRIGFK